MKPTLTLEFDSLAELQAFLASTPERRTIAHADRPDVGAEPVPLAAPVNTLGFGQGVTLPAGATPALPVAAAAPSQSAPVVPPVSSTPPPVPPAPAALPALVVPAPAVPAAPSTLAVGAPTFDSNGLPWDIRIHTGTRGVNKDGSWKARKNLDPNEKVRVEAELRGALAVNAALAPVAAPLPPAVPPAPLSPAQVAAIESGQTVAVSQAQMAQLVQAAVAPAAGLTGTGHPIPTAFPELMELAAQAMGAQRLTTARITEVLAPFGLVSLAQLSYTPNAVAPVAQELAALL